MRRLTYFIIDQTDPLDQFECEGKVINTFFKTSPVFNRRNCKTLIRAKKDIGEEIMRGPREYTIFHIAAHGIYFDKTDGKLDYTAIYRKEGKIAREVFRPDIIVRTELCADILISTCCETFNSQFVEVINGYGKIKNFIAPQDSPWPGDAIAFSLMFYNDLLYNISSYGREPNDRDIIGSFEITTKAFEAYRGKGSFRLFNYATKKFYP